MDVFDILLKETNIKFEQHIQESNGDVHEMVDITKQYHEVCNNLLLLLEEGHHNNDRSSVYLSELISYLEVLDLDINKEEEIVIMLIKEYYTKLK